MNWVDTLSLAVWASGALLGYGAGMVRVLLPFMFVVAGISMAGALGLLIGPPVFFFLEGSARQGAAGFFLILAAMLLTGLFVTLSTWAFVSMAAPLMSVLPMGRRINRAGGLLMGALASLALLAVILIGLQQYPVVSVGQGLAESSFASRPLHWLDEFIPALEIPPQ